MQRQITEAFVRKEDFDNSDFIMANLRDLDQVYKILVFDDAQLMDDASYDLI